ncbi:MAG: phosphoenolpyruvate--protein phosphotransferase [Nitrospina sp.]|jgi:phosphotransferase system enzyme I (PtsI)|nr:phosphoenolpyruvate--protein phosphotransferase [Nitrospina sp.]MBT6718369.1 phosphoenolpyruvate--protein phosphotransferase [Nitrospina sp.]
MKGIAVSKGVAIGKAYLLDRSKFCILKQKLEDHEVENEIQRFRDAIAKTKLQMIDIKNRAEKIADKYAVILDTYTLLLDDDILVNDTIENIRKNHTNAEWTLNQTLQNFLNLFDNINDDYLKGKKDDLDLLVQAILRNLIGHSQETLSDLQEPVIIVTHSLSPSDTLSMPRNFIKGLATETGGKTSHVGIFAAALGIPAVTGIKNLTSQINSGDNVVVDGIDGEVIVHPNDEKSQYFLKKQENYRRYEERLLANIHQSAETLDGHQIHLLANIESNQEARTLRKFGAEGVGLYRTEFLYMAASSLPGERELYENFKAVAQEMGKRPVVIRTLDIGMDKQLAGIPTDDEDNPALGLRGIRLSLAKPELFLSQLKGILRASLYGNVKILYPMITSVSEITQANELLQKAKDQLKEDQIPFDENIEIGAMIETPAATLCIDHILEHVDFVSIGTNDLIQYLLAIDRVNENVAHLYQPFHPAVIRALKQVFDAAKKANKKVSICGELGGDPMATMLLLGLGEIDDLSMEPHSIPKVKKIIRLIRLEEARQMADHVLNLSSVEEISQFIAKEMRTRFPDDFDRDLSFQEKIIPA